MNPNDASGWLSIKWPNLRRNVFRILFAHAGPIVTALANDDPETIRRELEASWVGFYDSVIADLSHCRRAARPEWAEMFGIAISLFGSADRYRDILLEAGPRVGATDPNKTFARISARALGAMRRLALNERPAHQSVWDRLDKISRGFVSKAYDGPSNRCQMQHFRELAAHIGREYPNDRNLPRTPETIAEYFFKNCGECFADAEAAAEGGRSATLVDTALGQLSAEEVMLLPDAEARLTRLISCLKRLPPLEARVIEMSYDLGDVYFPSVEVFCAHEKISRRHFYKLRRDAEEKLGECVLRMRNTS